ncbi:glutamate synthase-related protein [Thalassotalea sp. PS06]|uniref:glutamate synthase-related protein n=1 Tax=Thalassotalea sp. PS06 TaxID=2594005 RepID=UPI0011622BB8|nr:glutamate synthase-related protein [Thalassotalea sp. PS06]QDP01920.1 glutamate synthase [Thalassotalea sp. PS06]
MTKPVIANIVPAKVSLTTEKDVYFCACGLSANQPYCDGSHASTDITPIKVGVDKDKTAYLCQCKQSSNLPFCDGTHKQYSDDDIGKPAKSEGTDISSSLTSLDASEQKQPKAKPTPEEPTVAYIHELAKHGLTKTGHHGPMVAMGVPKSQLPKWDDIQIMVAQLAKKPLLDDANVETELVIGKQAKKPLRLSIPLFVSDMSFGSLSENAKVALAKGAQLAETGICSGEGGMLPDEQRNNDRYFYEYASAGFGYDEEKLKKVQAFHFKGGQAAKTGTGGHLPADKNTESIARVRGIEAGTDAISPATFKDLHTVDDFKAFANHVREITGGIPIGFKLSANHIEADIKFAVEASADYIILDGRGGGTGAAPALFRDHISVPTIPALARARHILDKIGASDKVTLIVTGGLRTPSDFVKALALGADGIALANSAMQAIGCVGARMCNLNNCPAGIATQDPELTKRLDVETGAEQLARFFTASTELMKIMARACGHNHLNQFNKYDIASWNKELSELAGIEYGGVKLTRM